MVYRDTYSRQFTSISDQYSLSVFVLTDTITDGHTDANQKKQCFAQYTAGAPLVNETKAQPLLRWLRRAMLQELNFRCRTCAGYICLTHSFSDIFQNIAINHIQIRPKKEFFALHLCRRQHGRTTTMT